jgi:flagellar basal-body rod protein FlgC
MYGLLDIPTSGMIAQRTRMEVISANLANKDAILDAEGRVNPYQRRIAAFAPGDPNASSPEAREMGVHIREIEISQAPPKMKWDPTNPYAYQTGPNSGYVPVPDIDPVTEQINAMEAMRAYEANAVAAEGAKTMMAQALRLIA